MEQARPDYVFHLAAQSYPMTSFNSPLDTLNTNIKPKVVHSMYYLEDCIMVGLYDIPIEKNNGEGKDIHTVGQAN